MMPSALRLVIAVAMVLAGLIPLSRLCFAGEASAIDQAKQFVAEYEATIRPLEKATALAWWNANVSGTAEAYKIKEEAENRLDAALADSSRFARLQSIRQALSNSAASADPILIRQIDLLHLRFLEKQIDSALLKSMSAKANAAEQAFNTYRARVDGKEMTEGDVRRVLKESKDAAHRKAVWEASKNVGKRVEPDLKALIKLRNQAAHKLGFSNYHDMQLQLSELSKEQICKLFDELHDLTREAFQATKGEIDARLAQDYGIAVADLRPWHYHDPFFQEAPATYNLNLDSLYTKADIPKLCREFYAGIGLPVDAVLARSDLYEKPGKCPHAFCSDLDMEGDVRVLANIVPTEYWMGTMLHELGHAVYSTPTIPLRLPYVLRSPAHSFTTEGVAMMFERFSQRGDWAQAMGLEVADPRAVSEVGAKMQRDRTLIFAAWTQVMVRFEMAMYANPDQDLNQLWWDLVEKYQLVHRPDNRNMPDYASKIHIVSSPAYYHNYMMGELFAAQLHRAIAREVLKTDPKTALYNERKEVGAFLKAKVFAPGRSLRWDAMVRYATGEELSAKALAADLGMH